MKMCPPGLETPSSLTQGGNRLIKVLDHIKQTYAVERRPHWQRERIEHKRRHGAARTQVA